MNSCNNDCSDELDPRVKVELENLNVCTDEINRLEIQVDEANAQFRTALSESTQRLKYLSTRLGKCIEKSRPYYDAVDLAKKAQVECQKAAIQFQRAASLHATAKETIALAEQRFQSRQGELQFDTAWQEMLNHATAKVMEADAQRAESERNHHQRAIVFAKAEQTVQTWENKLRSAIAKSKPYFQNKDIFQRELQILKERVQGLQKAVMEAKERYAQSLRNLEIISEQIHRKRQLKMPREPGVGAEKLDFSNLTLEDPLGNSTQKDGLVAGQLDLQEYFDGQLDFKQRTLSGSEDTSSTISSHGTFHTRHSSASSLGYGSCELDSSGGLEGLPTSGDGTSTSKQDYGSNAVFFKRNSVTVPNVTLGPDPENG